MKAISRIILYLIPVAIMLASGFFYSSETSSVEIADQEVLYTPAPETVPERVIESTLEGASMEPFIKDGQPISIYPDDIPEDGDIISFQCLVKKCSLSDTTQFVKFLKKTDEKGCIYTEGRKGLYKYNGQLSESFDSHIYGKLCPGEFSIEGVVR